MPSIFDIAKPIDKKFSPLKDFLQSTLALLKHYEALVELSKIVEHCNKQPRRTTTEGPKQVETVVQPLKPQTEPAVEKVIK